MKHLRILGFALILFTSFRPQTEKVYICNSSTAVAYHDDRSCRGLNKCTHGILEVTKKEAIDKYGRRACKICY